jgi:glycosyltransferase involved in cell wall biosynthesis
MNVETLGLAGSDAPASTPGSPLISVIIPLYCEGANLRAFLADVQTAMAQTGCPFELILIDDGSPDDTWKVVTEEARTLPAIRAVRLSRNFGKELAVCAGLERARGEAIVLMDGDGQHPPALLPDMLRLWQTTGADIVEAVKIKRGPESLSGKLGALLFYVILNKLSGFDLRGASDFKLMNRKAINAWLEMHERNVFFRGMTAWLGLPEALATRGHGIDCLFLFSAPAGDAGGCALLRLRHPFGSRDALSETGRPRRQRFRHRDSARTHHRKLAHDKPRHRGRISGPNLRRSERPAPLRGGSINRKRGQLWREERHVTGLRELMSFLPSVPGKADRRRSW